jgi:hypothetical protein
VTWIAICLPLMAVGVGIATVPLLFATHHQHTYGPHGSDPLRRDAPGSVPTSAAAQESNWTVCPRCSAVVVNQAIHDGTVHARAPA